MSAFTDIETLACEKDPAPFFEPEGRHYGGPQPKWDPEPAKALCRRCRVREACLEGALDRDERMASGAG
jgi:hypothetical protein